MLAAPLPITCNCPDRSGDRQRIHSHTNKECPVTYSTRRGLSLARAFSKLKGKLQFVCRARSRLGGRIASGCQGSSLSTNEDLALK